MNLSTFNIHKLFNADEIGSYYYHSNIALCEEESEGGICFYTLGNKAGTNVSKYIFTKE
jgi:hypothetical protein